MVTFQSLTLALGLGLTSGILGLLAHRWAWIGWVVLAPLCAAIYLSPLLAAGLVGLLTGALLAAPSVWGRFPFNRLLEVMLTVLAAVVWGSASALAALLWPKDNPAWGLLIFPLAIVGACALLERQGGRLANGPIVSQEGWLPAVHIARLGGDLAVSALLALSAAVIATPLVALPPARDTIITASAGAVIVACALVFGAMSYRFRLRRVRRAPLIRVAAVSVDAPSLGVVAIMPEGDVDGTIRRYESHVARALAEGAHVVVLPEVAVTVNAGSRQRWLDALSAWAQQGKAVLAAGLFDTDTQLNQLVIADSTGEIAVTYDKQHPVRGGEPKRQRRMRPALLRSGIASVSGVICYDLDYGDLVRPVSRAGGMLLVPSNDWKEYEEIHHRAAVWAAVTAGVPIVRSTGHGISAVYDAGGRVLARASSFAGPVVLIADVPMASQ